MNEKCILSVCIRTYNQEKYVEEAINSVLSQITTFSFEIIVSDDCSRDQTPNILKRIKNLNPDKNIHLILGDRNIGGPANLKRVIEASNSKFVTILDADDYYVDNYKLEKQVNFLQQHPEYAACFHNTVNVTDTGDRISLFNPINFHSVHPVEEFISQRWFVPIHSAMLRREYIEFPSWYMKVINDDYVIHLSVAKHAPYFYMPDVMVAYRHHKENTSHIYEDIIFTDEKLCYILKSYRNSFPITYFPYFDHRISEYEYEIKELKKMKKHPILKLFKRKFYSRFLKSLVKKIYTTCFH